MSARCHAQVIRSGFRLRHGGLAFGLAIRYVGFSLTYSIAIGISATIGTLMPLFWTPNTGWANKFIALFDNMPGILVFTGIVLAVAGIFVCGCAGAMRERANPEARTGFSFRRGIPLTIVAGILSAVFNVAILAGEPLANAAVEKGSTELLSWNAIYPFSHGGA